MRYSLITLLLAAHAAPLAARAQAIPAAGATVAAFVPRGYRVLPEGRATGDLNGDGQPDVVLALGPMAEAKAADSDKLPPRLLRVLLAVPGGGYRLVAESWQAVLGRRAGGVYGDAFAGVTIQKQVLTLNQYGGENWLWHLAATFRFQRGDVYLIRRIRFQHWAEGNDCAGVGGDYNAGDVLDDEDFVTGQFEQLDVDENCQVLTNKRGRRPVKPLRRLADYRAQ